MINNKNVPGSYYSVNQDMIFPTDNKFGIPKIKRIRKKEIDLSSPFLEYRSRDRDGICHFFMEDYRFESVWNTPVKAIQAILSYKAAISPQFSVYTDYPLAINLWNTYRNRWCGRIWQEHGQKIIPSVAWAKEDTLEFAFEGIEKGSVIATTMPKLNTLFFIGWKEMIRKIEPEAIILYTYNDKIPTEIKDDNIVLIENYWTRKNRQIIGVKK